MKVALAITLMLVAVFAPWTSALKVNFKDCGSTDNSKGVIKSVDVEPCTKEPCQLKRGTDVALTVNFTPKIASTSVSGVVHGLIGSTATPFPLPNPDGCRTVGCPTKAGESYNYKDSLAVEIYYPKISLTVKWQLVDDKNNQIWCFQVPAVVV